MDRKEYWNKDYVEYWKKTTADAEDKSSERSTVKKISGKDFKAPDIEVITSFLSQIPFMKDFMILDYGCGYGRLYDWLSDKGIYYGIDISQAMIDECIKNHPENKDRFIVAEGESLPFEDGKFDVVVCNGVFDACYQESALSEMLRVTKGGHYIMFSGKNDLYYDDDEEAYIAEVNARKKGHPNYFTDVRCMLNQLSGVSKVVSERYALRRGDYSKNLFEHTISDTFYEWILIIQKNDVIEVNTKFEKFSDLYSKTYRAKVGL